MLGLDKAVAFPWGINDSGLKSPQERYGQNIYAVRIAANHWLFKGRPTLNMPCEGKGIPSRAARSYRS